MGTKRITAEIPEELKKRVSIHCIENDIDIKDALVVAITKYLDSNDEKQSDKDIFEKE